METVLVSHPKYEANKAELSDLRKKYEDELSPKATFIRGLMSEREDKIANITNEALSDSVRKAARDDARRIDENIAEREAELRKLANDRQNSMQARERELFNNSMKNIQDVVNKIAEDGKYDYVIDNSSIRASVPIPVVMYSNPKFDITDDVIAKLGGKKVDKKEILRKAEAAAAEGK
jgi:Outer membrane protein